MKTQISSIHPFMQGIAFLRHKSDNLNKCRTPFIGNTHETVTDIARLSL